MSIVLKDIRRQHTIADAVGVSGFGYWSGRDVNIQFEPSGPNTGINFHLNQGGSTSIVPANVFNRVDTPRRTNLRFGGAGVDMVEHVMAALAGLKIDNCNIICSSQEMPGCDGSSLEFVEALKQAGKREQDAARKGIIISRAVKVGTEESWVLAQPLSTLNQQWETVLQYHLDYGEDCIIRPQSHEFVVNPTSFEQELASARTFVLQHEADEMRAKGLGLRVTPKDLILFNAKGPVSTSLRFPDECARHKVLDMVGDFALAGVDLIGKITAFRAGHYLNAELIKQIFSAYDLSKAVLRCA